MGAWHEGIYGNDLAQDFLYHLLDCYQDATSVEDLIERSKEFDFFDSQECQLVLADVEHALKGKTFYVQQTIEDLEQQIEKASFDDWCFPEKRRQALQAFQEKLNHDELIKWKDFSDWIEIRRGQDIFATFGKEPYYTY